MAADHLRRVSDLLRTHVRQPIGDIGGCYAVAYIPSALTFFALWTHAWISSVVLYAFLGFFSGMMLCVFNRRRIEQSLPIMFLASVLSVLFLISAAKVFQAAWIDFPPLTDRIARLMPDVSIGLTMLSCILSILAFPFAERISAVLLLFLRRVFSDLNYAVLRKEILTCPSACAHGWTMLGIAGNLFALLRLGKEKALPFKSAALSFFPYFLLCLAPFAWYLCTVNHSTIHSWFTNKACVVAFLSLSAAVTEQQRN